MAERLPLGAGSEATGVGWPAWSGRVFRGPSRIVAASRQGRAAQAGEGAATAGVRILLRLEGAAILTASLFGYWQLDVGWGAFAMLFLLPDLSLAGYLGGARVGAWAYNAAHSTLGWSPSSRSVSPRVRRWPWRRA